MLPELLQAIMSGETEALKWAIASLLLSLPIIILALSVHETAHGYLAYKLGDPTAKNMGRLTLNPIKHLDPIGFICMLAFGFGWAKPVPINSRYLRKPRRDMALTAVAGPISNLILAVIFAALYKIFLVALPHISVSSTLIYNVVQFTDILLYLGIRLNITLAIFNLLPIPPLDGSKIVYMFLPVDLYFKIVKYEHLISLALLVLLATGVLTTPLSYLSNLILRLLFLVFQII